MKRICSSRRAILVCLLAGAIGNISATCDLPLPDYVPDSTSYPKDDLQVFLNGYFLREAWPFVSRFLSAHVKSSIVEQTLKDGQYKTAGDNVSVDLKEKAPLFVWDTSNGCFDGPQASLNVAKNTLYLRFPGSLAWACPTVAPILPGSSAGTSSVTCGPPVDPQIMDPLLAIPPLPLPTPTPVPVFAVVGTIKPIDQYVDQITVTSTSDTATGYETTSPSIYGHVLKVWDGVPVCASMLHGYDIKVKLWKQVKAPCWALMLVDPFACIDGITLEKTLIVDQEINIGAESRVPQPGDKPQNLLGEYYQYPTSTQIDLGWALSNLKNNLFKALNLQQYQANTATGSYSKFTAAFGFFNRLQYDLTALPAYPSSSLSTKPIEQVLLPGDSASTNFAKATFSNGAYISPPDPYLDIFVVADGFQGQTGQNGQNGFDAYVNELTRKLRSPGTLTTPGLQQNSEPFLSYAPSIRVWKVSSMNLDVLDTEFQDGHSRQRVLTAYHDAVTDSDKVAFNNVARFAMIGRKILNANTTGACAAPDLIVVASNFATVQPYLAPPRAMTVGRIVMQPIGLLEGSTSLDVAAAARVTVHEIGHTTLANLADEYAPKLSVFQREIKQLHDGQLEVVYQQTNEGMDGSIGTVPDPACGDAVPLPTAQTKLPGGLFVSAAMAEQAASDVATSQAIFAIAGKGSMNGLPAPADDDLVDMTPVPSNFWAGIVDGAAMCVAPGDCNLTLIRAFRHLPDAGLIATKGVPAYTNIEHSEGYMVLPRTLAKTLTRQQLDDLVWSNTLTNVQKSNFRPISTIVNPAYSAETYAELLANGVVYFSNCSVNLFPKFPGKVDPANADAIPVPADQPFTKDYFGSEPFAPNVAVANSATCNARFPYANVFCWNPNKDVNFEWWNWKLSPDALANQATWDVPLNHPVQAFPGGLEFNQGLVHPSAFCKMNQSNDDRPFCPVCRDVLTSGIYKSLAKDGPPQMDLVARNPLFSGPVDLLAEAWDSTNMVFSTTAAVANGSCATPIEIFVRAVALPRPWVVNVQKDVAGTLTDVQVQENVNNRTYTFAAKAGDQFTMTVQTNSKFSPWTPMKPAVAKITVMSTLGFSPTAPKQLTFSPAKTGGYDPDTCKRANPTFSAVVGGYPTAAAGSGSVNPPPPCSVRFRAWPSNSPASAVTWQSAPAAAGSTVSSVPPVVLPVYTYHWSAQTVCNGCGKLDTSEAIEGPPFAAPKAFCASLGNAPAVPILNVSSSYTAANHVYATASSCDVDCGDFYIQFRALSQDGEEQWTKSSSTLSSLAAVTAQVSPIAQNGSADGTALCVASDSCPKMMPRSGPNGVGCSVDTSYLIQARACKVVGGSPVCSDWSETALAAGLSTCQ